MIFLADHNLEGQALLLWGHLAAEGWLDLLPLRLVTFANVGLPTSSTDRVVWQFAQDHKMLLLTGNRNRRGADSLEQTIREANGPASLPVITIARVDLLDSGDYRQRCITRLIEILLDLENYLGTGRLFIPCESETSKKFRPATGHNAYQ